MDSNQVSPAARITDCNLRPHVHPPSVHCSSLNGPNSVPADTPKSGRLNQPQQNRGPICPQPSGKDGAGLPQQCPESCLGNTRPLVQNPRHPGNKRDLEQCAKVSSRGSSQPLTPCPHSQPCCLSVVLGVWITWFSWHGPWQYSVKVSRVWVIRATLHSLM